MLLRFCLTISALFFTASIFAANRIVYYEPAITMLIHWFDGHHHTKVLMSVNSVRVLKKQAL